MGFLQKRVSNLDLVKVKYGEIGLPSYASCKTSFALFARCGTNLLPPNKLWDYTTVEIS